MGAVAVTRYVLVEVIPPDALNREDWLSLTKRQMEWAYQGTFRTGDVTDLVNSDNLSRLS